jgi:predicted MFS family arabinose efflux permease
MMSLNSGSTRLGGALGSAVGGLILTIGNYSHLGIVLSAMGITAFLVIFLFSDDPIHSGISTSN